MVPPNAIMEIYDRRWATGMLSNPIEFSPDALAGLDATLPLHRGALPPYPYLLEVRRVRVLLVHGHPLP